MIRMMPSCYEHSAMGQTGNWKRRIGNFAALSRSPRPTRPSALSGWHELVNGVFRPMYEFRLQIRSTHTMIWQAPEALETTLLDEAMQIADRLASACRRTAASSCNATRNWVVEIFDEANGIFYQSPILSR
jgi:hypothetical protein